MTLPPNLRYLARARGIETHYVDAAGARRDAPPDVVLAVLRAMGTPVHSLSDVDGACAKARASRWRELAPPVAVSWERAPCDLYLRVPSSCAERRVIAHVRATDANGAPIGATRTVELAATDLRSVDASGTTYRIRRVTLPAFAEYGVHEIELEVGDRTATTRAIAAPRSVAAADGARSWGVFLPLHALRTARDWGCGDLGGLEALAKWSASLGARFVGILPIDAALPSALECPYTPSTRRFWNELYVDVESVPELAQSPRAREWIGSAEFQAERARLRASDRVDHARVLALKTRVLRELHRALGEDSGARAEAFRRFVSERPGVQDHARFRAALEQQGGPWRAWSAAMREGVLDGVELAPDAVDYHAYVEWIASGQIEALARSSRAGNAELYLDLPVGVHPDGYDVWRERAEFMEGLSIGAPPDAFMRDGQDWGLPPPDPRAARRNGYRYWTECLRHHLRAASRLRIDHVMGLHHLFVIPHGAAAADGVYVRYPAEELHAVLALEAWRARATIVGEDLGTVSPSVRDAMARHGLERMYVLPFELDTSGPGALPLPRADSLASLGTHDTPTFHGFWTGDAVEPERAERWRRALLAALGAPGARDAPGASDAHEASDAHGASVPSCAESTAGAALERALAFLAQSDARGVLVNLEDLWLEPEPQNRPGPASGATNWRRKSRYALEEIARSERFAEVLRAVDRLRARRS